MYLLIICLVIVGFFIYLHFSLKNKEMNEVVNDDVLLMFLDERYLNPDEEYLRPPYKPKDLCLSSEALDYIHGLQNYTNQQNRIKKNIIGELIKIKHNTSYNDSDFESEIVKQRLLSNLTLDDVTRIEVIDHKDAKGRVFSSWSEKNLISLSFQDNNKTLKIFISNRYENNK